MRSRCLRWAIAATLGAGVGTACGGSSGNADGSEGTDDEGCSLGSEGCECTQGGGCDAGLECRSGLCVDPGSGSDASDDSGSSASDAGTDDSTSGSDMGTGAESGGSDTTSAGSTSGTWSGSASTTASSGSEGSMSTGGGGCGDGTVGAGEDCDGSDLAGSDCADLDFGGGTLACDSGCRFDTSQCFPKTCNDQVGIPNCYAAGCTWNPSTAQCHHPDCVGIGEPCSFDPIDPRGNCCPPPIKGNVQGTCDVDTCT